MIYYILDNKDSDRVSNEFDDGIEPEIPSPPEIPLVILFMVINIISATIIIQYIYYCFQRRRPDRGGTARQANVRTGLLHAQTVQTGKSTSWSHFIVLIFFIV